MKRYMGDSRDREKIKEMLCKSVAGWEKERLIALKMGFSPENTLIQISDAIGRDTRTIQRWFTKYRKEGLNGVLNRNFKGRTHTISNDEIMKFISEGLEAGRWNTLVQTQQDLQEKFSQEFEYHNVWYWVKKCKGVIRVPRTLHKKRDPDSGKKFK